MSFVVAILKSEFQPQLTKIKRLLDLLRKELLRKLPR